MEKDIREIIRCAKIVYSKQQPFRPVRLPSDDEIKQMAVEMVIGEIRYQIPYKENLATISVESFWDVEQVGSCDEVGLMQLMRDTKSATIDELDEPDMGRFNVAQNVRAGIKYKSKCRYVLQYGSYSGRLIGIGRVPTKEEELWAYNAGFGSVLRLKWWKRKDDVMPRVNEYVQRWKFYAYNYSKGIFDVYVHEPNKRYFALDTNSSTNE